jgi:hypothetical protein
MTLKEHTKPHTFFISASSEPSSRQRVRRLAAQLKRHGLRWYGDYDWTSGFTQAEKRNDPMELQLRAKLDKLGAKHAGLFIYLDSASKGANREYGARWGANKPIIRIGKEPPHLFDNGPQVLNYWSEEDFLEDYEECNGALEW